MKKPKKMFSKTVTEIPKRPKPVTTQHTAYKRECADCGHECRGLQELERAGYRHHIGSFLRSDD